MAERIRKASRRDLAEIARLHALSWRRSYRGLLSDDYLDNEVDQELQRHWTEACIEPDDLVLSDKTVVSWGSSLFGAVRSRLSTIFTWPRREGHRVWGPV